LGGYEKSIKLYGDGIGFVEYVDHMGTDLTVVNSARVSFGKHKTELDDRDKKLIKYLIKHKHTSTLEHCSATFRFKVPLFVRSQHHRHRTWSYNEISRRYTDYNIEFYEPKLYRTQHKKNRQASNVDEVCNPRIKLYDPACSQPIHRFATEIVASHHKQALKLFDDLLDGGVCREQARGVLPQNMYTEYYGTTSLLNALKFISLRSHEGAQWEIQKVSKAMLEILEDLYPITVGAYKEIRQS